MNPNATSTTTYTTRKRGRYGGRGERKGRGIVDSNDQIKMSGKEESLREYRRSGKREENGARVRNPCLICLVLYKRQTLAWIPSTSAMVCSTVIKLTEPDVFHGCGTLKTLMVITIPGIKAPSRQNRASSLTDCPIPQILHPSPFRVDDRGVSATWTTCTKLASSHLSSQQTSESGSWWHKAIISPPQWSLNVHRQRGYVGPNGLVCGNRWQAAMPWGWWHLPKPDKTITEMKKHVVSSGPEGSRSDVTLN